MALEKRDFTPESDKVDTHDNTVVPVMNGHPRDQAKLSVHDRWPHIGGTVGRAGAPNVIPLARLHHRRCHNYVCYSY